MLDCDETILYFACGCTAAFVKLVELYIKRVNLTVCKLYLKIEKKRPYIRGFCFYENIFMFTSISNVS